MSATRETSNITQQASSANNSSSSKEGVVKYPNKYTTDPINLNDFYSSLHFSEETLTQEQRDIYKEMEIFDYCNQQAIKIVGDPKVGQAHYIERLCSMKYLKGSSCLDKYVSFNAEETPGRLNSSTKDYAQFYYNLMHCQERDEDSSAKYKVLLEEREDFSNVKSHQLKDVFPIIHDNLLLKNSDSLKEIFSKIDPNSEDRSKQLFEHLTNRTALPQYENLRKCAKERYVKSVHDDDTFGLNQNNVNELAHKCFVPYFEFFTRIGTVLCRRQIENCLALGLKKQRTTVPEANVFYLNTCFSDDSLVADCMKYTEKYFIDKLEE
ncbi:predicted protein [Naegleria gruberi]|uniref:Predicted protein n=1 Tax=Naegleria gruberi TaxID=5762 RepID=D2VX71_NAEGR|nr:uncharacterized protein NAEGRDRAFT_52959 [Naegleria gruberi]EFC38575.1 predicted protein [Naegleria gruberi]|eukprot:XP_002671319.1 predicted protein [Naegleria gruberi strain NEG-M]